ncbi:MAG: hypothetical protein RL033_7294 [Pseudomonadota bacterium]
MSAKREPRALRTFAAAACLTLPACSDETAVDTFHVDPSDPVYMVFSTIEAAEDRLGYFATAHSLDAAEAINVRAGIEEPGGGRLYAEPGIGTFMIGGGESPTITRYEVAEDGSLTPGDVLSFANQGVSDLADDAVVFVSPSKAYFRDRSQLQLISFDPTRMELLDAFPLQGLERPGFITDFGNFVLQRDGDVYFPMTWYDEDEDRGPQGAALVRVQPETDTIDVTTDPRCSGLSVGLLAESGDMYWFSTRVTTWWRADPTAPGPHDCALRVRAGETTFDPSWELDVTTRTNGWPSVATVPAGGSKLWLRVLEESEVPVPEDATPDVVEELQGWQWYLLDVASNEPAVRNGERPLGSYYAYGFRVDGHTYTTENDEDYTESTLLELSDEGFVAGATVQGTVRGLARLK